MPILHIHSPEILVVDTPEPTVSDWVQSLKVVGAQAKALEPDFTDDITPECFRHLKLPQPEIPRFMIQVASDGETARLQTFLSRDSPEEIMRTANETGLGNEFNLDGEDDAIILGFSKDTLTYMGGLVMRLSADGLEAISGLFADNRQS